MCVGLPFRATKASWGPAGRRWRAPHSVTSVLSLFVFRENIGTGLTRPTHEHTDLSVHLHHPQWLSAASMVCRAQVFHPRLDLPLALFQAVVNGVVLLLSPCDRSLSVSRHAARRVCMSILDPVTCTEFIYEV